jgi:aryl-alcohol dehydrogenase-like predicted oxidoreductase
MKRREFLGVMTAAAGAPLAAGLAQSADAGSIDEPAFPQDLKTPPDTVRGDMRYRKLGRTGQEVSLIGLGGYHLGMQKDEAVSIKIIRTAIDHGVSFMDNSWDYNHGQSEIRMGKALRDGYRDKVFLMTKIDGRTKQEAARQIDESLQRLQTDHLDLLQHHEIIRMEDPDRIFAEGGANEAAEAARKAGKVRFIGFTGHKDPLVHLRMLEVAAKHHWRPDTVQMPLNVLDAHFRSFGRMVLPVLVREEIGVLGMKPLADGHVLQTKTATPTECLHYAMTMPTSVVITGCNTLDILKQALEAVKSFRPLTHEQVRALLSRTATAAADGRYEPFKTSSRYDSTAKHPEWLG